MFKKVYRWNNLKDIKRQAGFLQYMKTTGYSSAWYDVRNIYREKNWRKDQDQTSS